MNTKPAFNEKKDYSSYLVLFLLFYFYFYFNFSFISINIHPHRIQFLGRRINTIIYFQLRKSVGNE